MEVRDVVGVVLITSGIGATAVGGALLAGLWLALVIVGLGLIAFGVIVATSPDEDV